MADPLESRKWKALEKARRDARWFLVGAWAIDILARALGWVEGPVFKDILVWAGGLWVGMEVGITTSYQGSNVAQDWVMAKHGVMQAQAAPTAAATKEVPNVGTGTPEGGDGA